LKKSQLIACGFDHRGATSKLTLVVFQLTKEFKRKSSTSRVRTEDFE